MDQTVWFVRVSISKRVWNVAASGKVIDLMTPSRSRKMEGHGGREGLVWRLIRLDVYIAVGRACVYCFVLVFIIFSLDDCINLLGRSNGSLKGLFISLETSSGIFN